MRVLPPGSTVGILGGGQLGRMLAMAAARLGFTCHIYSDATGPAFDVAAKTTIGQYEDLDAIRAFAKTVDVITYEFENVPLCAATAAAEIAPVQPGPKALEIAQDRLVEKRFLASLDLPVAPFAEVSSKADLVAGLQTLGTPSILKTTRFGYDGKGQVRIMDSQDPSWALEAIGHAPAVLEGFVDFSYEVSVLAVRGISEETVFYDIPKNTHRDGILDTSTVPAPLPASKLEAAHTIARTITTAIDYVGVLAVELFYLGDNDETPFVVNEIAPRVHNSGHWTQDACSVSQFENHIRAVVGWPLGPTSRHSDAKMTNLIGHDVDAWQELAEKKSANGSHCLHLYGKNQARPGRKMGHITHISPKIEG